MPAGGAHANLTVFHPSVQPADRVVLLTGSIVVQPHNQAEVGAALSALKKDQLGPSNEEGLLWHQVRICSLWDLNVDLKGIPSHQAKARVYEAIGVMPRTRGPPKKSTEAARAARAAKAAERKRKREEEDKEDEEDEEKEKGEEDEAGQEDEDDEVKQDDSSSSSSS